MEKSNNEILNSDLVILKISHETRAEFVGEIKTVFSNLKISNEENLHDDIINSVIEHGVKSVHQFRQNIIPKKFDEFVAKLESIYNSYFRKRKYSLDLFEILQELNIENEDNLHEKLANLYKERGLNGIEDLRDDIVPIKFEKLKKILEKDSLGSTTDIEIGKIESHEDLSNSLKSEISDKNDNIENIKISKIEENIKDNGQFSLNELESLKRDYLEMPLCSEKIILKLIFHYSIENLECHLKKNFESEIASFNVEQELKILDYRSKLEKLDQTRDYCEKINEIKNIIKNGLYKNVVYALEQLQKIIRFINIPQLVRLCKTNQQAIEKIKNKNIFLLLGLTGSGKSTTIHFLAGSKMEEQKIDGKINVLPSVIKNKDLELVKVGISAIRSETRFVIPVRIPKSKAKSECDCHVFCDLPGFDDTDGPEMDISNSIAINECIQSCNGIRPIVIVSYCYGDKLQDLTKLIKIIKKMFTDFTEDIRYFDYIFTKYSEKLNNKDVRIQIEKIEEELKNKRNKNILIDEMFFTMIQDIIEKTKNDKLILINQLNLDPTEILEMLVAEKKFLEHPSTKMNISFSPDSDELVKKQIVLHFEFLDNILPLLDYDQSESDLIIYKIKEMIELKNLIKQRDFNLTFNNFALKFIDKMNIEADSCIKGFNNNLEGNICLKEENANIYSACLKKAVKYDEIINQMDKDKAKIKTKLEQNLTFQSQYLINKIVDENNLQEIQLSFGNLKKIVSICNQQEDKSKLNEVLLNFVQLKQYLATNIKEKQNQIKKLINNMSNDFESIRREMGTIKRLCALFENELENVSIIFQDLQHELYTLLKNNFEKSEIIIKKDRYSDSDIVQLKEINLCFVLAISSLELKDDHIQELKILHDKIFELVLNLFRGLNGDADSLKINFLDEKRNKNISFLHLEKSFLKINKLRNVEDFEKITNKEYNEILASILVIINNLYTEIERFFYFLSNSKEDNLDFEKFFADINHLKCFKWTKNYPILEGRDHTKIEKKVVEYFEDQEEKFKNISFENLVDIELGIKQLKLIIKFKYYDENNVQLKILRIEKIFNDKIKNVEKKYSDNIQNYYVENKFDYETFINGVELIFLMEKYEMKNYNSDDCLKLICIFRDEIKKKIFRNNKNQVDLESISFLIETQNYIILEKIVEKFAQTKIILFKTEDEQKEFVNSFVQITIFISDYLFDWQNNLFEINQQKSSFVGSFELLEKASEFINKIKNSKYIEHDSKSLLSYEETKQIISTKLSEYLEEITNFKHLNFDFDNKLEAKFEKYYEDLICTFTLVNQMKISLQKYFPQINFNNYEFNLNRSVEYNIEKLKNNLDEKFENMLHSNSFEENDGLMIGFNTCFYNLTSFGEKFKNSKISFNFELETSKEIRERLTIKLSQKLDEMSNNIENKLPDEAVKILINIKKLSNNTKEFQPFIEHKLSAILNEYITKNGNKSIGKLGSLLKQNPVGNVIVTENPCFESYTRSLFNAKIAKQDIKYVKENIEGDKVNKNNLVKVYDVYIKKYNKLIEEYLRKNINYKKFLLDLIKIVDEIKPNIEVEKKIDWNSKIKDKLPEIIAYLFALWTLMNSKKYYQDMKESLFSPHPAQVVAIFRMLGMCYDDGFFANFTNFINKHITNKIFEVTGLRNNLVEIGTGEGKSITLGITAATLALLGFDVTCVCYSKYLSERDYNAFKSLFVKLNLTENIHYGTIYEICQNNINKYGNINDIVKNIIVKNNFDFELKEETKRPKILIIDEVDVFFCKEFYGKTYKTSFRLDSIPVKDLIKYIWMNKKSIDFDCLKDTEVFLNCCNQFEGWKELIEREIKQIILYFKHFESFEIQHFIKDDNIGYKILDEVSFWSYGYYTLYTYFLENENKKIKNESLERNIYISIQTGRYSYADIPKENFYAILGLTGTLKALNEDCKRIIEDEYDIKFRTFMPSIYGRRNLKFDLKDDVMIETDNNHFKMIAREISKKLIQKRAVFVVLETLKELYHFYKSPEFEPLKLNSSILSEEVNNNEKNVIVNGSTCSGKVLLFTRIFGRGTDFVVNDENLTSVGGVHVIQTFLSEELSEEIQIQGRTARQGDEGSYSMVLARSSLTKFGITDKEIQDNSNKLYDLLNTKRNEYFRKEYAKDTQQIKSSREEHLKSLEFIKYLSNKDVKKIKEYLMSIN